MNRIEDFIFISLYKIKLINSVYLSPVLLLRDI